LESSTGNEFGMRLCSHRPPGRLPADPEVSWYVNVTQTIALVEKLLVLGVNVLFLSSNRVLDGREPHVRAAAQHSPVGEYGRQKAHTEAALSRFMVRGAPVGILRLAKVK
jgi:dTDP-4-dehydrorhamnose reductase